MQENTSASLRGYDNRADSEAEIYHENSKAWRLPNSAHPAAVQIMAMSHGFKVFADSPLINLPAPDFSETGSLGDAVRSRQSVRSYAQIPLDAQTLSTLLFGAYGRVPGREPFRTVPSGGGLYPLEVYIVVLLPSDLKRGVYHYNIRRHGLELIAHRGDLESIRDTIFVPEAAESAAVFYAISAVFGRSRIKYGERAYRFALLEAGHVAQNLALLATSLNLGFCPFGGFVDDEANMFFGLDGVDEAVVYMGTLGVPEPS